jgi:hypothetical protein
MELPADLAHFLLCHAAVSARDEEATRQSLRATALELTDSQAMKVVSTLHGSISGGARLWLQRMA